MFEYLFERQARRRDYIIEKLKKIPVKDLRKRVHPNKWSVEELIRHIIFTTEFWMRRIIFQGSYTPFHPIGVENNTQASKWYSLDELAQAIQVIYVVVIQFLYEKPDYNKVMIFENEEFVIKWILWHILQHELETWGQIAERIRTYGHPTPWEF